MRTFKRYSLSSFQICNSIDCNHHAVCHLLLFILKLKFIPFDPLHTFIHSLPRHLWQPPILCIYEHGFFITGLDSTHKWSHTVFVFSVCLINSSLTIIRNLLAYWVQHFHIIIFQDLKWLNWNSITSTSFARSDAF